MGVMDSGAHVGKETTYGTPVTPTRSYEAYADGHKRQHEYLESAGMRAGFHTMRSDRRRVVNMGAEGSMEVDVMNKGMGLLLQAAFGAPAITTPGGGTNTRLHTYQSNAEGPTGESLTVVMDRAPVTGANIPFRYHGGKVTELTLTQEVGALLKATFGFDFEDETQDGGAVTPIYPAAVSPYGWPDCVVTVNAVATDSTTFSLTANNSLKTDRRLLRGNVLKKQPVRTAIPVYEGALGREFEDTTEYNRFVAGTIVPIVATWTGTVIEAALAFFLKVTLAACQYTGESPEVTLGEVPMQPLPFKVLHNGTDPAIKVEYQTTDLAA